MARWPVLGWARTGACHCPEGIAIGRRHQFSVGSLLEGAVYRGDLRTGEGEVIDLPT